MSYIVAQALNIFLAVIFFDLFRETFGFRRPYPEQSSSSTNDLALLIGETSI